MVDVERPAEQLVLPVAVEVGILDRPVDAVLAADMAERKIGRDPVEPVGRNLAKRYRIASLKGGGESLRRIVLRVEAFGADLQLSLVARGAGVGLVTADLLATSAYRDQLKVLSVSDFRIDVIAWLIHRALPPRLEAPIALLLEQLKQVMAKR